MPDLLYYEPVTKIDRFDILISDVHAGDDYKTISSTTNLSLQQVWDWLCDGGDWSFRVTAHNQPDHVFMSGLVRYESLRAAAAGEVLVHLCSATDEEAAELKEKAHNRIMKETFCRAAAELKNQSLVDYLADGSSTEFEYDTSKARRAIVEGLVKVNGKSITDPSFRLPFETGFVVEVDKND